MTIEEILALGDVNKITKILKSYTRTDIDEEINVEQKYAEYRGKHKILTAAHRAPRTVGKGDAARTVYPVKEILTYQKKIVRCAIAFLFGSPISIIRKSDEDKFAESFQALLDLWDDLKLDFFNKKLMRALCVETAVAELWYAFKDPITNQNKARVMLLSRNGGDLFYPYFDSAGDMVAFLREYKTIEVTGDSQKSVRHIDIYTAAKNVKYTENGGGGWDEIAEENILGKIPVVYYEQDSTEWDDVQMLIDRLEDIGCRHGDVNDYFGAPIITIKGVLAKAPDKDTAAKSLQFKAVENPKTGEKQYGSAEYLTWDHSPESTKLEIENLKNQIYSLTSTPNIDFDNVKGITSISGIALRLLFLDAIIKAGDKQEIFGPALLRRLSIMKSILSIFNLGNKVVIDEMKLTLKFNSALPDSINEIIESLSIAAGGKPIMSQASAVRNNPYVEDAEQELEAIAEEAVGDLAGATDL